MKKIMFTIFLMALIWAIPSFGLLSFNYFIHYEFGMSILFLIYCISTIIVFVFTINYLIRTKKIKIQ